MKRRGFSLAELMVALVIAGVIGVALTRLVISQARFVSSQDGNMRARAVARSGLAVMVDELRQVPWGGVLALGRDSIVVRVPYAWGIVCGQLGGATIVGIMPPDSTRYAAAINAGYVWRDTSGVWNVVEPATRADSPNGVCLAASPQVTAPDGPAGSSFVIALTPNVVATPPGVLVYAYQRVTYRFAASGELPGRRGLWRQVMGAASEELVAPFDTSSRFSFLVGPMMTVQTTVPVLDSLRGIQVRLLAATEGILPGKTAYTTFNLTSDIVFRNREQ